MQHRIWGSLLLLSFSLALIPAELFHHHDWESEICKETDLHFADHAVDCDLADFYLAKHLKKEVEVFSSYSFLLAEYIELELQKPLTKDRRIHKNRGPPELS